jgi:hypothetical protein
MARARSSLGPNHYGRVSRHAAVRRGGAAWTNGKTTCQFVPGLARTPNWLIAKPFMSQTATAPLLFSSTMSVLPLLF